MATSPIRHLFHPGDVAAVSGVYRVVHRGHRADHRVMIIKGDEFPRCRRCSRDVTYELIEATEYGPHDWDFAGPNLRLVE
ncbi:MAG TPA: hypothetical protein VFU76_02005 [Terriglobales bacterium]|nr:hypothetical protein [Terriglobales bacterium]